MIVADVYDYPALADMAQSTSVVINVAGPCALAPAPPPLGLGLHTRLALLAWG